MLLVSGFHYPRIEQVVGANMETFGRLAAPTLKKPRKFLLLRRPEITPATTTVGGSSISSVSNAGGGGSSDLPADPKKLRKLLGLRDAVSVKLSLKPGKSMGCIMEEADFNGIAVIRVHKVLPHVHPGLHRGDIVANVNGHPVRSLSALL